MFVKEQSLKYAIQAIHFLKDHDDFVTSSEIIRSVNQNDPDQKDPNLRKQCIGPTYADKVLSSMVKHGILTSSWHGFKLNKPYEEIKVKDVLGLCPTFETSYNPLNRAVDMIMLAAEEIKVKDLY